MSDIDVTPDDVVSKMLAAKPGDVLHLAPGTYPPIGYLKANYSKAEPGCVLRGARNALIPYIYTYMMDGWWFDGFEVSGVGYGGYLLYFLGGKRLKCTNLLLHAPGDDTSAGVSGVILRRLIDSEFSFNELHHLRSGVSHAECKNLTVRSNALQFLTEDAIRGGEVQGLLVEKNLIANLIWSGATHPDAIQLWTTGAKAASTDIVIRGNTYVRGQDGGLPAQGVFIKDEGGVGYDRVLVEGNAIYGGMYNGINFTGVRDGRILNNFVVGMEGHGSYKSWLRVEQSTDVVAQGNTTNTIVTPGNSNTRFVALDNVMIPVQAEGDMLPLEAWRTAQAMPPAPEPPPCSTQLAEVSDTLSALLDQISDDATARAAAEVESVVE